MTGRRRVATRAGWGFADQALSSLTNFALGLAVARSVDPASLGAFGLVFTTYLICLNVARPLAMEPLLIRFSGAERAIWRRVTASATGLSLVIGVAGGAICAALGLALGGKLGAGFLALAPLLPGLMVQDSWRLAFFAAERGKAAFSNDLVWAIVLLPSLAVVLAQPDSGVPSFIFVWGASATVAAVFGLAQSGVLPKPAQSGRWLRDHRGLAGPLTVESVIGVGAQQLANVGVAAVAGLATVGALRAAQLLLGPLLVIFQGLQLIAIPEGARLLRRSRRLLWLACLGYAGGMALVVISWGVAISFLPGDIGVVILRSNWVPAQEVVVPYAVALAVGLSGAALLVGLRVLADARRVLSSGVSQSLLGTVGQVAGAAVHGAVGAALGAAIFSSIGLAIIWHRLRAAINEPRGGPDRTSDGLIDASTRNRWPPPSSME